MSASDPNREPDLHDEDEEDLLDADDAAEEIDEDSDHPMDEDDDEAAEEEIQLQNDSTAHFDHHTDSIFCIAAHPTNPSLVITGGGDDVAYLFDTSLPDGPLLPASYETTPEPRSAERTSITPLQKLDGHTDSVNAVAFTQPKGEYVVTAGLDGKIRAWRGNAGLSQWSFVAEAQEVEEINWVAASPHPSHPNVIALGANDGSVWVYQVNAQDKATPLNIIQAFYMHTESCTAGAWTPDGKLLATVSEDGSFHVYDVFGEAAAAGATPGAVGHAVVSLTADDQRFAVEGGLYCVAISPGGTIAAVGGAGGNIKVVGLPRIGAAAPAPAPKTTGGAKSKAAKKSNATSSSSPSAAASQAGQILASLQSQSDSIETLSFSPPPSTLLAAGSIDGSIALFDVAQRFTVRRHIRDAHEEFAVVKVEFEKTGLGASANAQGSGGWGLMSAGMDGVVRRWDGKVGGTGAVGEWRGHRGEGEGGGVLGFARRDGVVVTAGDDSVSLVFRA